MARYPEVFTLWEQCEGIGLSRADEEANISSYLARNPGLSFIALAADNRVVGAVLAGHDGRRGYIHHLAVHPDYRRLGLGRQLADKAIAALKQEKIGKCHLFIYTNNTAGIRYWEATGWTFRTEISLISRDLDPVCGGDC